MHQELPFVEPQRPLERSFMTVARAPDVAHDPSTVAPALRCWGAVLSRYRCRAPALLLTSHANTPRMRLIASRIDGRGAGRWRLRRAGRGPCRRFERLLDDGEW